MTSTCNQKGHRHNWQVACWRSPVMNIAIIWDYHWYQPPHIFLSFSICWTDFCPVQKIKQSLPDYHINLSYVSSYNHHHHHHHHHQIENSHQFQIVVNRLQTTCSRPQWPVFSEEMWILRSNRRSIHQPPTMQLSALCNSSSIYGELKCSKLRVWH